MSFRGYVSATRRIHFQLPSDIEQAVRAIGAESGFGLGPAIRLVLRRGLTAIEEGNCRNCVAALASLVASEHAVLMVAAVLPDGERRVQELGERAAVAAEERLAMFREGER
jgi:hypothetical protein